jgi:arylsulfatase A-like enzyme
MTLFGQACLAARRLVEAGCPFITVFWDGYGQFASCAWDTHANHYPRLREYLLPGFDLAYSALLDDLEARGLLDSTLVVWLSEHGRTPKIDSKPKGAGRHHWSRAYSAVLAGGGSARGKVVGATDKLGGDVHETPVSPKDVLATIYHLLGIDPETHVPDLQGRPMPIAGSGRLRAELLG